uniref:Uncharacterized protein n=1 Tax=Sander lucioperca TaxID=283035 RepID=A0A8C9YHI6_SANLU
MKIAAFNVKRLGWKKVNNADVRNNLIKIVSRYSVVVLLEVMDKSGKAMNMFLTELNKHGGDEVKMIKSYQYEERTDVLAREPYILQFECPNTGVCDLHRAGWLLMIYYVVFVLQNIMILGDFNADGRYLLDEKKKKIRIRSAYYCWLIGDDVDTTTSNSNDHTYDRIVVYHKMLKGVVPNSAQPFNFQRAYRLSDANAAAISDHYPVEVDSPLNTVPVLYCILGNYDALLSATLSDFILLLVGDRIRFIAK